MKVNKEFMENLIKRYFETHPRLLYIVETTIDDILNPENSRFYVKEYEIHTFYVFQSCLPEEDFSVSLRFKDSDFGSSFSFYVLTSSETFVDLEFSSDYDTFEFFGFPFPEVPSCE